MHDQLTIFDYPNHPGARRVDTSIGAAKDMQPRAATIRDAVLKALQARPLTSYELAAILGLPYHTVQPRTSELKASGHIVDSGERRIAPTGKKAIVWRAA